jgi:signal transduction histidine kinase
MIFVPGSDHVLVRERLGDQVVDLLIAALAATDHGVMITSLDHTTLACNARFGEIWGVDPEAVVHSTHYGVRQMVADRIPDMDMWVENLEQVYASASHVQSDELDLKNPRSVLRRFTGPVWDAQGKMVARIWTFLDITREVRRRRRSQLLQDAALMADPAPRRVYQLLVEEVANFYDSVAILSIRHDDFMEFRAVGAPPGHPALSMAGNTLADAYCQFCLADGPIIIQDARQNARYKNLLPLAHGLTRYAGTPVISPYGEVIGTLCILDAHSDDVLETEDLDLLRLISMRIGSELERERYINSLESDLEDAQQMAIRNEKLAVTGTLAAAVAHDIRNILTAMQLDRHAGADSLDGHIDRFALLAHRLLSYAKPTRLMRAAVELADSIERVRHLLHSHAQIASIRLVTDVPRDLPSVLADPARLDHLFVNLILNAIQAMGKNGTITVTAREEKGGVEVTISDTGPGLSEAQIAGLFQPFASSRADGFGLGLFSAQQIARESGGTITVTSRLGEGATFCIWLPTANEAAS